MKVYLSHNAELKLLLLTDYLKVKWNDKTKDDFLKKLNKKIEMISKFPESCPETKDFREVYKCVVSKQTTFYYRILLEKEEIEIITVFDTRQNPDSLLREI
ncbi:type II toxin-antitoxin system RelE/ParE family toxin [Flavobacterium sp. RSB2_4_14]|uniref:type II toxin-antitoxin system RelE/ParE family toxin n=1 Tax=Flavobacterium sp. RSB2_4_14 TaxID=3447665 RepID=UPI003F2B731B